MTTQPGNKVDPHYQTPEEDAFTSEGGHVGPEPKESAEPTDTAENERKRSMPEGSIQYDGRCYQWSGYWHDRRAGAVVYAGLTIPKPAQEGCTASLPHANAAVDLAS